MTPRGERRYAERAIFELFAGACGLPIDLASIESREPPEPDIACDLAGEGMVAFELGEVVGEGFSAYTNERPGLRQKFREAYGSLPPDARSLLRARFGGDPVVFVAFVPGTKPGQWRRAIRPILETLLERVVAQDRSVAVDEDDVPVYKIPRLRDLLTEMIVRHASGDGASLHVMEATESVDATLDLLRKKFEKSYRSAYPIELVAYRWTPSRASAARLSGVQSLVAKRLPTSPFRRVWVFDCHAKRIELHWPTASGHVHARG